MRDQPLISYDPDHLSKFRLIAILLLGPVYINITV